MHLAPVLHLAVALHHHHVELGRGLGAQHRQGRVQTLRRPRARGLCAAVPVPGWARARKRTSMGATGEDAARTTAGSPGAATTLHSS